MRTRIDAAFDPAINLINDSPEPINMPTSKGGSEIGVNYYAASQALRNRAFEIARDRNRQDKINAFMAKVENLTEQLEDLQNQIEQG